MKVGGKMTAIILFDGVCNLCNSSVQFIIKRDPQVYFYFASLQSEYGKQYISKFELDSNLDSIILIENGKAYVQSTAALRVCKQLSSPWKLLAISLIIPVPIRNLLYKFIAKNRYKWFGKREMCMIPTPAQRKRFLS
jgi:predicted DCC family thiol-disulfide oxidoreductase YuxK